MHGGRLTTARRISSPKWICPITNLSTKFDRAGCYVTLTVCRHCFISCVTSSESGLLDTFRHSFCWGLQSPDWWLPLLHPFNGLFSRTTWVSRYQKGQTSLKKWCKRWWGFGMAVASAEPYANNLHLSRQITTPMPRHPFLQARWFSWRPTNNVKALKAVSTWWRITRQQFCQDLRSLQNANRN